MATKETGDKLRYGIGEWYGHNLAHLSPEQKEKYARIGSKKANELCPFRQASAPGALCNKKGGVCTLRQYKHSGEVVVPYSAETGLVTVCPNRFWEANSIFAWVGERILHTVSPTLIKEVDFLASVNLASPILDTNVESEPDPVEEAGKVGRIDIVLVYEENGKTTDWCSLEMQAVYFSGPKMAEEFLPYIVNPAVVHFPTKIRRPDWRSSGPKRLMPQLQIKVPTLRRWGKKMAVVIDRSFFNSLGSLVRIKDLSNADIAWFVVDYDRTTGAMKLFDTIFTTLESSVEGLTAGVPIPKGQFERELGEFLNKKKYETKGKVMRLAK